MNNKKDVLPIVIAAVIALAITGAVRWLIPSSQQTVKQEHSRNEVSMPEIPLMVKKEVREIKKIVEHQVLMTSRNIKKDEKINESHFTWKKWPADAMQPYFIARDEHGTPLNNGADYNNSLKMWARTDIPGNIPMTIAMLTSEDPVQKAEEEKRKKEEEARKQLEIERAQSFIRKGMRAVTFSIDQRSASSSNMLGPGDLVDVLIVEQRADRMRMHKYKALKILAIDGVTRFESAKSQEQSGRGGGLLGGVNLGVSSFLSPKNVTLEVREKMVEVMLRQANTNGIILSLRSQIEPAGDDDNGEDSDELDAEKSNSILDGILSINKSNPINTLLEEKARKETEERNMSMLMNNITMVNSFESNMHDTTLNRKIEKDSKDAKDHKSSGSEKRKYEVISGKVVGEVPREDPKTIVVYRKLTPTAVKFDDCGKKMTGDSQSNVGISGFSGQGGKH